LQLEEDDSLQGNTNHYLLNIFFKDGSLTGENIWLQSDWDKAVIKRGLVHKPEYYYINSEDTMWLKSLLLN